jgi:type IV secretory pathway TrbD component
MADLTNPTLIKLKGLLFLLLGIFAAALILVEHPEWRLALLLGVAIWSFCRFYYFAFYVIEKYVDPSFRFAGLSSFVRYLIVQRRRL